jgi:cobalt/nickel transport protein
MNKFKKKIGLGLVILALISPLGIILPNWFHAGGAWGEWSTDKVKKELGYVPKGMEKNAELWKAPMSDYSNGKENNTLFSSSVLYILSGFVGLGIISLATWGLFKIYQRNE